MKLYGTDAQFARAAASYDNASPPDGCECLSNLQAALLAIPAFVMEAEDNADLALRHKLHLYATTGDKAAFNGLSADIANEYAELRWTQRQETHRCCEAAETLLADWEEIQREEERAAA